MHKKNFILIFLSLCITSTTNAQLTTSDSISYSKQIITMEQSLLNDIATGDTALWAKYLDKDFYIITEDGSGLTRNDFLASFGPLPKGFSGHIDLIKPHLVFHFPYAVCHYVSDEYETVFGQKIHTTYATMNTYYRLDTSWKILSSQVFEVPALPAAIDVSPAVLKKYAGTYYENDTISCAITVEGGKLYIQKKGRKKEQLLAETDNVFFRQADARGRKIFITGDKGMMLMLERRNGQDVVWKRK